ncbi:unnamed protein product [Oikopleura dioica]|uniref:Uncharacterized protein n=1 Tax=Oikopleura dioica TaxID=34765 RepID=E4X0D4_OIKDI|nr:unnamed protein product [Oikopleura dioica]
MGLFLDFMSSLRVTMNSILILLGCRNRPKEAYPTEQLVEDIEEFEDELQFDRKFHETLIVVREERRMWASIQEMESTDDDSRFMALFRRGRAKEDGPGGNNDHTDYGLWTLSWNKTPRSPLKETKQPEEIAKPIDATPVDPVLPQVEAKSSPEVEEEPRTDEDVSDIDPPLKMHDYDNPPIATITYCWEEEVLPDEKPGPSTS